MTDLVLKQDTGETELRFKDAKLEIQFEDSDLESPGISQLSKEF